MEKKMDSQVEKERQILSMEGEVKRSKMQTYQGIEKDNYELLVLQKNKQIQRKRDD